MKRLLIHIFLFGFCVAQFQAQAQSLDGSKDDSTQLLIDRVLEVYGGNALRAANSFRITTISQSPTTGQEHTPELVEINTAKRVLLVDLENQRAAIDNWNKGRAGVGQGAIFVSDGKVYNLNINNMTYTQADSADLYQLVGGAMRTTDVLLVKELDKSRDEAKIVGDGLYMGREHTLIEMPFPSSPVLTLYIDKETSLVSKMRRINPALGHLDYVFTEPTTLNGMTFAAQTGFFIAGQPTISSVSHKVEFDVALTDADFAMPDGAKEAGEVMDASEMVINKISDRVYHVGQNGGFSIFVDTPQGVVSAGGYPGISERFDVFRTASGSSKLLTHQIVTHHHSDHVGGLGEAADMGAKLLTVAGNVDALKENVTPAPHDWQILKVGSEVTISEGREQVNIYEVATSHAASFLVTYVPATKTVFIADHFGSPQAKGIPAGNLNTVTMYAALDKLGIDIKTVLTAHNPRVYSFKEMKQSADTYSPIDCELDRPVCQI